MKTAHEEFLDRTGRYILRSDDWSRLAEVARRASISALMRKNLSKFFYITLVSGVDEGAGSKLSLFISPLSNCWDTISHLEERELSQLIQKYEMLAAYISGLDDALPGDIEE
jgi:hypothetical protein